MEKPSKESPKKAITKTLFYETKGESEEVVVAVASTIYNRYKLNREPMGKKNWIRICEIGY